MGEVTVPVLLTFAVLLILAGLAKLVRPAAATHFLETYAVPKPRLVVSVGPDPEEVALADAIVNELGLAALSTQGKLSWAQLAGLLSRARLFVGVDTAAMHLDQDLACQPCRLLCTGLHPRPRRSHITVAGCGWQHEPFKR